MRRKTHKASAKRSMPATHRGRPAGIQAMDVELYARIQQAIRALECSR